MMQPSPTRSVPARGRRHPVAKMLTARRLKADGRSNADIGRILGVSKGTIGYWTDSVQADARRDLKEAQARRQAAHAGATGGLIPAHARPEYVEARMAALSMLGLDDEQITAVMNFDLRNRALTVEEVAATLNGPQPRPRERRDPSRDDAQREAARRNANRVRLGIAALKDDLANGRVTFSQAALDLRAARAPLGPLLRSQRGWGKTRIERALSEARLPASARVGDLSDVERRRLVRAVNAINGGREWRQGEHGKAA